MSESQKIFSEASCELGVARVPEGEEWPESLPLRRELPEAKPYPVDALGEVLGGAVRRMNECIQSPEALCAQSVLAGTALAVQAHADVVIDGRSFPVSENFITVAASGERKSATDAAALAPHNRRQRDLSNKYIKNMEEAAIKRTAWTKERDGILKEKKILKKNEDKEEGLEEALRKLGPCPELPIFPILTTEEPTFEGLVKALAVGWPSMGVFSDEGGRFLGGYGMNPENQLKTSAGLSKLFDGSAITRTRAGDGNSILFGRRVSLHLMVQPDVSNLLFANKLLNDQGFPNRCLPTYPSSTIGTRKYNPTDLSATSEMKFYFRRMMEILEADLPLFKDSQNTIEPRKLPMGLNAKVVWVNFHDQIEGLCKEKEIYFPVKGFASKAADHAARLAGILTLVGDLVASEIPSFQMEAGVRLVQYYLGEALRLFNAAWDMKDLELAEKVLTWARGQGDKFSLIDLYQRGPNPVRNKYAARRITEILIDHGWIRAIEGGGEIYGVWHRDVFEVRPLMGR